MSDTKQITTAADAMAQSALKAVGGKPTPEKLTATAEALNKATEALDAAKKRNATDAEIAELTAALTKAQIEFNEASGAKPVPIKIGNRFAGAPQPPQPPPRRSSMFSMIMQTINDVLASEPKLEGPELVSKV